MPFYVPVGRRRAACLRVGMMLTRAFGAVRYWRDCTRRQRAALVFPTLDAQAGLDPA